ncbi:hypothetical protein DFH08DRAFT_811854 [Mycena albidolilacea]|uniref:Uncharacterized protein n=1 Tax=Mycena albidolilacea TaxID=1033008 RepID=A0AAD6ZW23_9AGAR|nr:hypothetical protein DFH08DRAFT_811854 [Mycena albidolilacea]
MDNTMDDTGKVYLPTEIKTLRHKLADALKSHANMVDELIEDADELQYRLAVASRNLEDTTRKLVEIKHQLYDLCQLILLNMQIGGTSWLRRDKHLPKMGISSLGGGGGVADFAEKKFRGMVWISQIGTPLDTAHFVGEAGECRNFGGRSGGGLEIYFNCWQTALGRG